jgi:subtilase family serine protease
VLTGNMHPLAAASADQGEADASLTLPRITIHFKRTAAQEADLTRLLQSQQDRSSGSYHKWLTEAQFANRFGVSDSDLQKVTAWLQSAGFTDVEASKDHTSVSMSGTAAQAQYALRTSIHRYILNGASHYANSSDPVLPKALEGMVAGIRGLTDFHPRPRGIRVSHPRFTSSISGNIYMAPADFATIYDVQTLYNSGIDGTGQKIAIPGQSDIQLSNIDAFRAAAGLSPNDPQVILTGKDPGTNAGDESESELDIEWAGAVARNAAIVFVNSPDAFTSAEYAIDNDVAPVLSITYGLCEAQTDTNTVTTMNAEFQKANAKGITVVAASGDAGAADCDEPTDPNAKPVTVAKLGFAVDFPGSSPFVTVIGGTEFNEGTGTYWSTSNNSSGASALSYVPEMAWNDTATAGDLAATGGGKSTLFAKPSWQQGAGVPADGKRDVPDVSLDSSADHEGFLYCTAGWCTNGFRNASSDLDVVGGTSVSTPTFAGIVALINQKTNSTQGNINPTLYSLASISTDAFHDITAGNNNVPCQTGTPDCTTGTLGYSATTGYDLTTGLGSVDANNLVNEWNSDFQIAASPASLTINAGGSGTAAIQITRVADFTGSITLTCTVAGTLTSTTCSVPSSVSGASGSATLTIANTSAASGGLWRLGPGGLIGVGWLLLGMSGLLVTRRRGRFVGAGAAFVSLLVLTACGSGSDSSTSQAFTPAPLSGSVTVTATAGVLTRSTTVAVSIP